MSMMEQFFAQRIVLGKSKYEDVPAKLKDGVKKILIDNGLESFIPEENQEQSEEVNNIE